MKRLAIWTVSLYVILVAGIEGHSGTRALFESMVPRISKEELNTRLDDSSVIIMDVRRAGHFNASPSKIKGAIRVNAKAIY